MKNTMKIFSLLMMLVLVLICSKLLLKHII